MLNSIVFSQIGFECYLEDEDLYNDDPESIETDQHITCFYGKALKPVDRKAIISDIKSVMGEEDFVRFMKFLEGNKRFPLLDMFSLGKFEQADCDFLVLHLKEGNNVFDTLKVLNKGLVTKYDIALSFSDYNPHLTLAKLKPGMAGKYINEDLMRPYLKDAEVQFQDFTFSEGYDEDEEKWKQYAVTSFHSVERYFYQKREKEIREEGLS